MAESERYSVEHITRYAYTAPVSQSWQLARLTPRTLPWQRLLSHSLQIEPKVDELRDELDSFGNMVTHFGLYGAHRMLRVRMECRVEVTPRPILGCTAAGPLPRRDAQATALQMQSEPQVPVALQMQSMTQTLFNGQTQVLAQSFDAAPTGLAR